MRTLDRPVPVVARHVLPADAPMAGWPYQPVIALERLPQPAYTWDDENPAVVWDAAGDPYVYDAPFVGSGFTDALCDMIAVEVDPGEPDELGLFPATTATVTLANAAGQWTLYDAAGRLVYWAPGRELCVWAHRRADDTDWWLFRGRVASWTEAADGTVTVTAHDGIAQLAEDMAGDWTAGTAGQRPLARIQSIAAAVAYTDPIGGDTGDVTLTTVTTADAPIDVCHRVALSDGGVFAGDADGRLLYRDRLWRAGRADQGPVAVLSDNVCTADAVIWEPEMGPDDMGLATDVELINVAGLRATARDTSGVIGRRYRLTHPDADLWTTQGEGDAVAAYLLGQSAAPVLALRRWTMHLHDPRQPQLWPIGVDLRRGDLVRLVHGFIDAGGAEAVLDVFVICWGAGHAITADTWDVLAGATRTVDYLPVELWDRTALAWDDPNPDATWRY